GLVHEIRKATPTVALTLTTTTADPGAPVGMSVQLTSGFATPTGSVVLFDGPNQFAFLSLNASGFASLSPPITTLAPGTHMITAQYLGNATFNPSSDDETLIIRGFANY